MATKRLLPEMFIKHYKHLGNTVTLVNINVKYDKHYLYIQLAFFKT